MRIASYFKRRSRPRERLAIAGWACAWVASLSFGCFFELEDVALSSFGGGGSGGIGESGGTGGTSIGGAPIGGTGGSAGAVVCGAGQKDCGRGCEPFTIENGCGREACTRCAALPQASVSCNEDGNCQLEACDVGFADCDADANGYTGEPGGNGCEYSFASAGDPLGDATARPLAVPLASIDVKDGSRSDWAGVLSYPLLATCDNCVDDAYPPVIAQNEVPSRRDLDAWFRVAWDQNFFYVLADVYDSSLFNNGASLGGQCQNGAPCEDGLQIFIDGRNDRASKTTYDNTDLRMFIGASEKVLRIGGTPPNSSSPGDLDLKATVHEAACYRIEAKISWPFIVVPSNLQPIPNLFPPAVGQEYGFDLAVNDWRPGAADETPRRESQLFWVSPAPDYRQVTSGFGPMRLAEGPGPAGAAPQ